MRSTPWQAASRALVFLVTMLLAATALTACSFGAAASEADGRVDQHGFDLAVDGVSAKAAASVAPANTRVSLKVAKHTYPYRFSSDLTPIGQTAQLSLDKNRQPASPVTIRFKVDQSKVAKANWSSTKTYAVISQSVGASKATLMPATYDAKTGEVVVTTTHFSFFSVVQLNLTSFFSGFGHFVSKLFGQTFDDPACAATQKRAVFGGDFYEASSLSQADACIASDASGLHVKVYSLTGIAYRATTTPPYSSASPTPVYAAGDNFAASMFSLFTIGRKVALLAPGSATRFDFTGTTPSKLTFSQEPAVTALLTLMAVVDWLSPEDDAAKATTSLALSHTDCMATELQTADSNGTSPLSSTGTTDLVKGFIKCAGEVVGGALWTIVSALPALFASFVTGILNDLTGQMSFTIKVTDTGPAPVLADSWTSNQEGFGTAAPATVYNGGDPTGLVRKIVWTGWGSATAVGTGEACYLAEGQFTYQCTIKPATIIASNLGSCAGKPAYEDVGWYFPGLDGETSTSARGNDVKNCNYGTADTTSDTSDPVLGDAATAYMQGAKTVGFGVARPATINQDPSAGSGYTSITWSSWGSATALGQGQQCSAAGHCTAVTIKVSNLGTCGGKTAYEDAAAKPEGASGYDEQIIYRCSWTG